MYKRLDPAPLNGDPLSLAIQFSPFSLLDRKFTKYASKPAEKRQGGIQEKEGRRVTLTIFLVVVENKEKSRGDGQVVQLSTVSLT